MSMSYRTRSYGVSPGDINTAGTYSYQRYEVLLWTEEAGNPYLEMYSDSRGLATIGIGFLLVGRAQQSVRDAVFTAMGIVNQKAIGALNDYFNLVSTSPQHITPIATIQAEADAILQQFTAPGQPTTFAFQNDSEVKAAFQVIVEENEAKLNSALGSLVVPQSDERIALLSLMYNGPGLIGPALKHALVTGNRAEAWYEIRYNSNAGLGRIAGGDGVAKRRYWESQIFGLYDEANPIAVTLAEAQQAYRTLTRHREQMFAEELNWGTDPDGASPATPTKDIATANFDYPVGAEPVQTLSAAYQRAFEALLIELNGTYPELSLVSSDYRPTDVLIAPDDAARNVLDVHQSVETQDGVAHDISGDARFAANIILGGDNGDVISGGKGADVLAGGDGLDTYLWTAGDGNDRIRDSDGRIIVFLGPPGAEQPRIIGAFVQDGSDWKAFDNGSLGSDSIVLHTTASGETELQITTSAGTETLNPGAISPSDMGLLAQSMTPTNIVNGDRQYVFAAGSTTDYAFAPDGNIDTTAVVEEKDDVLLGTTGSDQIFGGAQDDALHGGDGDDWLDGGTGDDVITGGAGSDRIFGGDGDDHIDSAGRWQIRVPRTVSEDFDPPAGSTVLSDGRNWSLYVDGNGFQTFEYNEAYATPGTSRQDANDAADLIDGGAGDDIIAAGLGDDYVLGGTDDDVRYGRSCHGTRLLH